MISKIKKKCSYIMELDASNLLSNVAAYGKDLGRDFAKNVAGDITRAAGGLAGDLANVATKAVVPIGPASDIVGSNVTKTFDKLADDVEKNIAQVSRALTKEEQDKVLQFYVPVFQKTYNLEMTAKGANKEGIIYTLKDLNDSMYKVDVKGNPIKYIIPMSKFEEAKTQEQAANVVMWMIGAYSIIEAGITPMNELHRKFTIDRMNKNILYTEVRKFEAHVAGQTPTSQIKPTRNFYTGAWTYLSTIFKKHIGKVEQIGYTDADGLVFYLRDFNGERVKFNSKQDQIFSLPPELRNQMRNLTKSEAVVKYYIENILVEVKSVVRHANIMIGNSVL